MRLDLFPSDQAFDSLVCPCASFGFRARRTFPLAPDRDAALALHQNAKNAVQAALAQKLLEQLTDAYVQGWMETSASFGLLVISPFVLIQHVGGTH